MVKNSPGNTPKNTQTQNHYAADIKAFKQVKRLFDKLEINLTKSLLIINIIFTFGTLLLKQNNELIHCVLLTDWI